MNKKHRVYGALECHNILKNAQFRIRKKSTSVRAQK